jgi:uncharacterized membrane protein
MSKYSKFVLVGIVLLVFGVTLVATSYFKIYDTVETIVPTAGVLPIQANSTSYFVFNFYMGPLPESQKALVLVAGSQELQDVLNPALNYNATMKYPRNITITVFGTNQNMNVSASETTLLPQTYHGALAFHTFDIPASWNSNGIGITLVSITNPENYPVCWIVNVMLYGQVVNSNWLTVFFLGIVPIILGLVIVGVAGHRRKANNKKQT